MTLYELTARESGIVIAGNTVIVANWATYDDDRMPMIAPGGFALIQWPEKEGIFDGLETHYTENCRELFPEDFEAYDRNCDLVELFDDTEVCDPCAHYWTLPDGRIIIAPVDWC